MKTKSYKYGKHTLKAYSKKAGEGWEVGFFFDKRRIFVGNFIHTAEATEWWKVMNEEVRRFTHKHHYAPRVPKAFYSKFFSNHMYNTYYGYLDKAFSIYATTYGREYKQQLKRYEEFKKQADHRTYRPWVLRAA